MPRLHEHLAANAHAETELIQGSWRFHECHAARGIHLDEQKVNWVDGKKQSAAVLHPGLTGQAQAQGQLRSESHRKSTNETRQMRYQEPQL
jgi:hypothetical protein